MPNPAYNVLALLTAAPYQRQINTSVHPRILNSWLRISLARSHGVVVGAGAAVPSEGEDRGEAEVLPERPQADVPQGALRRDHLRRHPPRAGCVEHVPRCKLSNLHKFEYFTFTVCLFLPVLVGHLC